MKSPLRVPFVALCFPPDVALLHGFLAVGGSQAEAVGFSKTAHRA